MSPQCEKMSRLVGRKTAKRLGLMLYWATVYPFAVFFFLKLDLLYVDSCDHVWLLYGFMLSCIFLLVYEHMLNISVGDVNFHIIC